MNTKTEVIEGLRNAKAAHMRWKAHVHAVVQGLPPEEGSVPMNHSSCKLSKWYYTRGRQLRSLETYVAIEEPHNQLHRIYDEILKLLFGENDGYVIGGLSGENSKSGKHHHEEAKALMMELFSLSTHFIGLLNQLEKEILDMSDQEIEALA